MGKWALAIDIGASGGKHVLGRIVDGRLQTREIYRFPNGMIERDGRLCWDVDALFEHVLKGMRRCGELGIMPDTVGIDTWGVDYVLLDQAGKRLGEAIAYRDGRTAGMMDMLDDRLPNHYELTGIARQPYNTVYQWMAEPEAKRAKARKLLFMPCYLSYLLCGAARNEATIASTSGLVNVRTGEWDAQVLGTIRMPLSLLCGSPAAPGTVLGALLPEIAQRVGYCCRVILPACHDTASAFMAIPAVEPASVFLSSGTWSLIGLEMATPLTDDSSRRSGFTNEGGWGGTVRYMKNLTGMWMLQSLRREQGEQSSYGEMVQLAAASGYEGWIDVDDGRFLAPVSMTDTLRKALREGGFSAPQTEGDLIRAVLNSLALSYAENIRGLRALTGASFQRIHLVGGGSLNALLNQMTADMAGLPVLAGPVEGTAMGSLCAQLIAMGELRDLAAARELVSRSVTVRRFDPCGA